MEISVRSYLTAGMAAVVGATAISLAPLQPAPALQASGLPASAVAEITLTGTSIPWDTILTVVKALSSGGSLQAGVTSLISAVGTEFAKEALPVVTAFAGDVVMYVGGALADLFTGPDAPQIDLAAILATATAAITAGNISGAVTALTSGLSVPLSQITKVLFTPEFQAFITGKVGTVLGALPEILRSAVQTVVGIDIKPIIDLLSGLITKILPAASTAPRALSAAAQAAPVVVSLTTITPAAAADVPAAPEAAPAAPAEAPAVKAEAAPAAEAVPVAQDATEAAPAAEVVEATPAVETPAVETVAPVESSLAVTAEAVDSAEAGPVVTRAAKPAPRGRDAAPKAAASRATAAAGRG